MTKLSCFIFSVFLFNLCIGCTYGQSSTSSLKNKNDNKLIQIFFGKIKNRELSREERLKSLHALAEISPAAIPFLIQLLGDKSVDREAADTLVKIGPAAATNLIKTLKDEEKIGREWAAWVLGKIRHAPAVPDLIHALKEKNWDVRNCAAWALGEIGALTAVPDLIRVLKDKDYAVRKSAVRALGEIGALTAIPDLICSLQDEDQSVRYSAAQTLGRFGRESTPAISSLIETLKDKYSEVRWMAAWALGKIGPNAASTIPQLILALNDEEADARMGAAFALFQLGRDDIAQPVILQAIKHVDPSTREYAIWALENIGTNTPFVLNALKEAINDEYEYNRKDAARVLKKILEKK